MLLYENGCVVRQTSPDEPLLLGETEAVVIGGNATFKLQMGPSVLSSKLGKQNFRIRIEPIDGSLRSVGRRRSPAHGPRHALGACRDAP